MIETSSPDAIARGSIDAWLGGAYRSLIESGIDSVRITPLSKKLGLARTSFYWFFKDRGELLAALLDLWRTKNTDNLTKQTLAYAESITEATLNVFDCWFDPVLFDSAFEFAVRSWALQSKRVSTEIHKADAERLEALQRMFVRFGYQPPAADVRARTLYLTQIGYISMETRERTSVRLSRIPHYVEIFTGRAPPQRELDRFMARHASRSEDTLSDRSSRMPAPKSISSTLRRIRRQ